jgi:hypothetical protein
MPEEDGTDTSADLTFCRRYLTMAPLQACAVVVARRGVQTELNREISGSDNRADVSVHLFY